MKKRNARLQEPFWVLPDGDWIKVVGQRKADVTASSIEVRKDRLVVPIPKRLARELSVRKGTRMRARYSRGVLVVERIASKKRGRGP